VAELSQRIADHGGAALIVDYGDWRSQGDTVQAVSHHQPADPLAAPGTADLTAHLDFEALYNAAKVAGLRPTRLTTQGVFLERLGLTQRAQTLAKSLSGAALDSHIAAHRRLTHPDEMGGLFKVMGFVAESAAVPPGLEP
jgi:SAM-dependent MidA family methyltransferase